MPMFKDALSTLPAAKHNPPRKHSISQERKRHRSKSFFRSFSKPSCKTFQIQKEKNKHSLAMNTRGRRPRHSNAFPEQQKDTSKVVSIVALSSFSSVSSLLRVGQVYRSTKPTDEWRPRESGRDLLALSKGHHCSRKAAPAVVHPSSFLMPRVCVVWTPLELR
jgi:hypothetical protein